MELLKFPEKIMGSTPEEIINAGGKSRRNLYALCVLVAAVVVVAFIYFRSTGVVVGHDSVAMWLPSTAAVGDRDVVIGATDDVRGNTILDHPMTVGHNAQGAPGSVVIGADAKVAQ